MIQWPPGWPGRREWTTKRSPICAIPSGVLFGFGALTERPQIRHHATAQLVDRLARRGMVRRRRAEVDRRGVVVQLTTRGEVMLKKLALQSLAELGTTGPTPASTLTRVIGRPQQGSRRSES